MAQVALAWVMARPGVAATLIGARELPQLRYNIAAAELTLSEQQMTRLDAASAPAYGPVMTWSAIRRIVFGGHSVTG